MDQKSRMRQMKLVREQRESAYPIIKDIKNIRLGKSITLYEAYYESVSN